MDGLKILLAAFGFAMFLEGLPYFVSPAGVRRYLAVVARLSDGTLRTLGLVLMGAGLLLAWACLREVGC